MRKTSKGNTKTLAAIGNSLIALSIVGVLLTFYPIIKEELSYRTQYVDIEKPVSKEYAIRIPSIKINEKVLENIDPWKPSQYRKALQKGVAHAKGSALPNQEGSIYLFAHSSDLPWRMTRANTAFFRLSRVKIGDQVIITYQNKDYYFQVQEKKTVWPNEVQYLTQENQDQLILQTCTPIGTSLKRLLVFAEKERRKP